MGARVVVPAARVDSAECEMRHSIRNLRVLPRWPRSRLRLAICFSTFGLLLCGAAVGAKAQGEPREVGTMIAQNDVMSLNPTKKSDLRVVKVRIRLDPSQEASRLVNLQVTIRIDTSTGHTSSPPSGQAPPK